MPSLMPPSFCMCHGTCKSFHLRAIPARDQLLCVCRWRARSGFTPAADSIRHRPVHAAQVRPRCAAALPTRLALQVRRRDKTDDCCGAQKWAKVSPIFLLPYLAANCGCCCTMATRPHAAAVEHALAYHMHCISTSICHMNPCYMPCDAHM